MHDDARTRSRGVRKECLETKRVNIRKPPVPRILPDTKTGGDWKKGCLLRTSGYQVAPYESAIEVSQPCNTRRPCVVLTLLLEMRNADANRMTMPHKVARKSLNKVILELEHSALRAASQARTVRNRNRSKGWFISAAMAAAAASAARQHRFFDISDTRYLSGSDPWPKRRR